MASQSQNANNWTQVPRSGDNGNLWTGIATALQTADANVTTSLASRPIGAFGDVDGCPCAALLPWFPAFSLPVGDIVIAPVTISIRHKQGIVSPGAGDIIFENTGTTLGTSYTTEVINLNPLLFTVAMLNAGPTNPISLLYHGLGYGTAPLLNNYAQPFDDQCIFSVTTQAPPPPGGTIVDSRMTVNPNFSEKVF